MICTYCVDSRKALKVFCKEDSLLQVDFGMDYMKQFVGKVVDSKTQGSCIPTDSVKSSDDCPILVHNTGIRAYIDSDKTNLAYLVGQSYVTPGW